MSHSDLSPRFAPRQLTGRGSRQILSAAALAGFGMLAPLSMAGTATIDSSEGGTTTFEYTQNMLRMGSAQPDSYVIIRDGSMFVVSDANGSPMVFDAGSMMKGMGNVIPQVIDSDVNGRLISLKDTGENETVAGIRGDVYELRFEDSDGREQTETLVLSTDRRAVEFRDALFLMLETASQFATAVNTTQGEDLKTRLGNIDAGVLRYGSEMSISSITDDTVPPSRFELPAQPMDMQGLGNLFGAMSENAAAAGASGNAGSADAGSDDAPEEKKGLFSSMMGALGNKAERQEKRVGNSVDNEVDKQTDEAVDNAIGKAFGKLFGR